MGAVCLWNLRLPFPVEVGLVWLALFAPMCVYSLYIRVRYSDNVEPYRLTRCSRCGSGALLPLRKCLGRKLMCPKCGRQSVSVTVAGKS